MARARPAQGPASCQTMRAARDVLRHAHIRALALTSWTPIGRGWWVGLLPTSATGDPLALSLVVMDSKEGSPSTQIGECERAECHPATAATPRAIHAKSDSRVRLR